jgi:dephospho-CoA kinase
MSEVLVIGLTGNIATGKSTVTAMLARRGAYIIDADQVVHQLLDTDPSVQSEVAACFGPDVRTPGGMIDRVRLGVIVFASPAGMRDLERILHPRVGARVDEMIAHCDASVVVVEAIKLLESELRSRCQAIWVTTCPEEDQIRRLTSDRDMTREGALARIRSQSSQAVKLAQADVVIDTSGTLDQTEEQVEQAWRELRIGRDT